MNRKFKYYADEAIELMNQKTTSKIEEPKLFLEDVLLTGFEQLADREEDMLRDLDFGSVSRFWFKNQKHFRRDFYPRLTSIHFNELMKVDLELFADFFHRFPLIDYVGANDLVRMVSKECECITSSIA